MSLYRLPEGQDKPRVGEWVHLAGTYNGETGKMSLYVDGELIGTADACRRNSAGPRKFESAASDWSRTKRAEHRRPDGEFDGYVRDVRIYDRALSDEEIKTLAEEARTQVTK